MYEVLINHITTDEPFGPIDSGAFDSDPEVLDLLFEKQNRTYKDLFHKPSIIMGRRGSGKTSYLRTVYFDKQYDFHIEIRTADWLEQISSVIQGMAKDATFTETISELWEKILWTCVISEIHSKEILPFSSKLIVVGEYLGMMGIKKDDEVEDSLWKLVEIFKDAKSANPTDGISEVLRKLNKKRFSEAQSVVIESLKDSGKTFVILMDSLEDFRLDIGTIRDALQGLLKCVGSMNKPSSKVDIRFCLPTELYRTIIEISSNQTKDFDHSLRLEWKASELVLIGAQRLIYFLELYYPGFIKRKLSHEKIGRADAMELFNAVLPEKITNRAGFQENSISYILRHTQLLPRHFLKLLNSIFKRTGVTQSLQPFPISEDKIKRGIRIVEEPMVREIFGAFKMIHPNAAETCKRCLPELGHEFSRGDLRQVFNRYGKAPFGGNDFFEFERMLVEIGAIGRVARGKVTDVYIKGSFEYHVSNGLSISHDDKLCIHPLFSGAFRGKGNSDRPVYPRGSILDDDEEE